MIDGTEWKVEDVVLDGKGRPKGDGDTVTLYRSRVQQLGDERYRLTDVDPQPVRLVWVDTPERGHDGYAQADADLDEWIVARFGRLRVVCYESAGWERLLGDLVDDEGNSASQYLLSVKHWPLYVKGK